MDHIVISALCYGVFISVILLASYKKKNTSGYKRSQGVAPVPIIKMQRLNSSDFLLFIIGLAIIFAIIKHRYPNESIDLLFINSLPLCLSMLFCLLGIFLISISQRNKMYCEEVVNYEIEAYVGSFHSIKYTFKRGSFSVLSPVWHFTYFGVKYRIYDPVITNTFIHKYNIRESKMIRINPNNPTEAIIKENFLITSRFLGIILAIGGAIAAYYYI